MVVPVITVAHTHTHRNQQGKKKGDSGGRRNSFHRAGYFIFSVQGKFKKKLLGSLV